MNACHAHIRTVPLLEVQFDATIEQMVLEKWSHCKKNGHGVCERLQDVVRILDYLRQPRAHSLSWLRVAAQYEMIDVRSAARLAAH